MDRLAGMELFVAIAEAGSLTAAAERLGMSAQMVGKHLRAVEARLGAAVLTRTTRRQSLTEVGRSYYDRCKLILEEVRLAESTADALREAPRGRLRITAPVTFGTVCLAPALVDYLAAYPEMSVELSVSDKIVDVVEEGFDVAVRVGSLADSGLVARPLAPYGLVIAAAPSYLARAGVPRTPADLSRHQCLGFTHWRHRGGWRLGRSEMDRGQLPLSRFESNHGPALRMVALEGFGLVLQPEVLLAGDLSEGRLVAVLPEALPPPTPMNLVFPRAPHQLPKLRTFIDFMADRFGASLVPEVGKLARTASFRRRAQAKR